MKTITNIILVEGQVGGYVTADGEHLTAREVIDQITSGEQFNNKDIMTGTMIPVLLEDGRLISNNRKMRNNLIFLPQLTNKE